MKKRYISYCIYLLLFFGSSSFANDTLARVTTSGLEFEKSHEISMESEELYISLKEIRVKYIFKNKSKEEIKAYTAFPFPKLSWMAPHEVLLCKPPAVNKNVSEDPDENCEPVENPYNFDLKVNGKSLPFRADVKVDKDSRTIELKYYWEQVFPPDKEVSIEHSYKVAAGSSFPKNAEEQYCFDSSFKTALTKLEGNLKHKMKGEKDISSYLHYQSRQIEYILKTGANWHGPIKSFKMTLDKIWPENLLSLCWDGLRKTSNTTFVFEKKNFTPNRDLQILIIDNHDLLPQFR